MSFPPVNLPRRLLTFAFSSGPWRLAPLAEIAKRRTDETRTGVHHAESFAGVVYREEDEGCVYPESVALLSQSPTGELLPEGPRYFGPGICAGDTKTLYTLSDAAIAGRDGVVYCPRQRAAVAETVRCWTKPADHHPLLGAARFPRAVKLPGVSLSLATLDAEGFYHFLIESMPRLWLARDFLATVDHVLVSGPRQTSHGAWLAQAGVPEKKIIWMEGHSHYRCEQLLFANRPLREYQPTPWLRRALGQLLRASSKGPGSDWLWISRADARNRNLIWEDELLARFPRFEKIMLAAMPVAEQINRFTSAAVVAGPHGAGLANLVFAAPRVRLLEFFPDEKLQPIYGRLAHAASGRAAWASTDFRAPTDLEKLLPAMSRFLDD